MSHGVVHFEIPGDDPEALASFYTNLFGWQITRMPGDDYEYWSVSTVPTDERGMPTEPGGINGGLMRRTAPEERLMNYVNVESVDDFLAKAKSLGASVLVDKTPIPGMGWFAQFVDPQGNHVGLFQVDNSAA